MNLVSTSPHKYNLIFVLSKHSTRISLKKDWYKVGLERINRNTRYDLIWLNWFLWKSGFENLIHKRWFKHFESMFKAMKECSKVISSVRKTFIYKLEWKLAVYNRLTDNLSFSTDRKWVFSQPKILAVERTVVMFEFENQSIIEQRIRRPKMGIGLPKISESYFCSA